MFQYVSCLVHVQTKADNLQQFLRDWLTNSGLKGKDGVGMTDEVVTETASKYREAFSKITGQSGL